MVYHHGRKWNTACMPTRHRRVQVTVDPELSDALDAVRDQLGVSGGSATLRELALRGARATLTGGPVTQARQQWVPRDTLIAALGDLPPDPALTEDLTALGGELTDPWER
jgi:hypothetical protein